MTCLALVLELHHPLPGPGEAAGLDWSLAAAQCYWPLLRSLWRWREATTEGALTLAVSPSWMALAADPAAQALVVDELNRDAADGLDRAGLREFVVDRWQGRAESLLRALGESGKVDLIPTTSSHTWLPAVAEDAVIARAQVALAAADLAARTGGWPSGIWLPFLSYLPGLESTLGEAGLRYFGVAGESFVRGTVRPPDLLLAPMATPAGVACFGVDPEPFGQIGTRIPRSDQDPRQNDPREAAQAAAGLAEAFLDAWMQRSRCRSTGANVTTDPVSVVALSAHDLMRWRPAGAGVLWLDQVLARLHARDELFRAVSLSRYLDRQPSAIVGRPGPSAGGWFSARPADSDLFDRCRVAADLLTFAVERRHRFNALERDTVAHMTRCLLRAQQVDWAFPPGLDIDPGTGIQRARAHLDRFHELAGLLMAGRVDPELLRDLDRGHCYLPSLNLDLLGAP